MSFSMEYSKGKATTINAHFLKCVCVHGLPTCISVELMGNEGTRFVLYMTRDDATNLQAKVFSALAPAEEAEEGGEA